MKRLFIISAGIIITLFVIILLIPIFFITGERVANFANDALGDEFHVEIKSASFNPLTRTLTLEEITVFLGTNEAEIFKADQIKAERIGIIEAFRENISVGLISLQNYYLNQELLAEAELLSNGDEENGNTSININSIELLGGTIHFAVNESGTGNIQDLNIRTGPLNYDPSIHEMDYSLLQDIEIEILKADFTFWDNRYVIKANSILIDEHNSLIKINSVYLDTPLDEMEFYESLQYRTDLFRYDLKGFAIEGLDFSELREERFQATSITLDYLDLHVSMHKAVPEDPDKGPQPMPLEALNNIPYEIAVETIIAHHADIRYSEYDEDGVRPGTIHFANTRGEFVNVHSNSAEPIIFTAHSFLEETGELNAEFRLSMNGGQSITEINGNLGRFEAPRLNNILKDLEGIHIKDGVIHSVHFDFVLRNEDSEGSITLSYDDFEMEFIDMDEHEQGFRDTVLSFLVDDIVLRASTLNNNGDSRTGEISVDRDPEKSFFNYLWVSLRSGILEIARRV